MSDGEGWDGEIVSQFSAQGPSSSESFTYCESCEEANSKGVVDLELNQR